MRRGDFDTAAKIFRAFSSLDRPEAEFMLGTLYASGKGVSRDFAEAARLYDRAAQQGDANASFALGNLFARGVIGSPDSVRSAEWYRRAAETGHALAQSALAAKYVSGDGVETDYAIGMRWLYRASQQGLPDAQLALAKIFASGRGVERNYGLAYGWALTAATSTNESVRAEATKLVGEAGALLTADQMTQARTEADAWSPRPEGTNLSNGRIDREQDGIAADALVRNGEVVLRWRFLQALSTPITEISGIIEGKDLGAPSVQPYPQLGAITSIVLLLDISDPKRQRQIELDKLALAEIVGHAGANDWIDIALYSEKFELLSSAERATSSAVAIAKAATPRNEHVNLGEALRKAIELPTPIPHERKGILVLTDAHSDDELNADKLIQMARRTSTSFYFIVRASDRKPSLSALELIAKETRGRLVMESELAEFVRAPAKFLDSGATARFPLSGFRPDSSRPDPDVKLFIKYGDRTLELRAPVVNDARLERHALHETLDLCGDACSDALKKDLRNRLDLIAAEEETYRAALDDPERLRDYAKSCQACSFREGAVALAKAMEVQRIYAKLESAGSTPSKINLFLQECGSICPEDVIAEAKRRLVFFSIAGTYSGRVESQNISGVKQSTRMYRLTIESDMSTGRVIVSDAAGQRLFDIALVGRMIDDRTFEGKTSVVNASRPYKPDTVQLIFSLDKQTVEWRQTDGVTEGVGILSR
jgi:hypothetical protein